MEIPSSLLSDGVTTTMPGTGNTNPNELGRTAFLELLVTQLSNQDPLNPLQDQEFVAQLAQFSSLEQLENMNETMQASLLLDQSVNNSLATNLIGKEVLAEGSAVELSGENEPTLQVELAADAHVVAIVRDSAGNIVRTFDEGDHQAGSFGITWDGKNDAGDRVADGTYEVEILATDESSQVVEASTRIRALVTGVRFLDGMGYLMVGDAVLPLSAVVEVLGPQE